MGDRYQYSILYNTFSETEINNYAQKIRNNFKKIIWDDDKYSEWMIRNYLSIKMIFSSSIMLSSCEYSIENNIKVVEPYLYYYSMLNCCRCFLYSVPYMEWNDGGLIGLSHNKIINNTENYLKVANKNITEELINDISFLKYYRELFSYHFPANGIKSVKKNITFEKVIKNCQLLVEIAQFNSSILSEVFIKNFDQKIFNFKENFASKGFIYEGKSEIIIDEEDYYRIGFICRKYNIIYSLYHTMTEGMVEDFFGAWCSDTEGYNPDENWRIIFNVP